MAKLSVHLVSWNGAKYIPYLFDSLRKQTYTDWELFVVDNASTDETVALIQKELVNFPFASRVTVNTTNTGFAGGHNQAFKAASAEYFLLLNQDMYLMPDCLEKMVQFLDEHSDVAAVSPRLMCWAFSEDLNEFKVDSDRFRQSLTHQIDALGLKIFRNRRVVEQHTREEWSAFVIPDHDRGSIANEPQNVDSRLHGNDSVIVLEVFGVSGAFPMLRRSIINEIVFSDGTFLDESYHSYKEDMDLAYRLAAHGTRSYILSDTVAYHDRSGAGPKELSDWAAAKNKSTQSSWVRYHSYKNHLMTLYKNEYWQNALLDAPWILWYEIKKFVYFLLFEPRVLRGLGEVWKMRKDLKIKRLKIKELRKVGWREMRKWWR